MIITKTIPYMNLYRRRKTTYYKFHGFTTTKQLTYILCEHRQVKMSSFKCIYFWYYVCSTYCDVSRIFRLLFCINTNIERQQHIMALFILFNFQHYHFYFSYSGSSIIVMTLLLLLFLVFS